MNYRMLAFCVALSLSLLNFVTVHAQEPDDSISYQGFLEQDGEPLSGNCDFIFELYNSATDGTRQAITQTTTFISDGLVSIDALDFGDAVFEEEQAQWLEIQVRCGNDTTPTKLTPRTRVNNTPKSTYSLTARNAVRLGDLDADQFARATHTHSSADIQGVVEHASGLAAPDGDPLEAVIVDNEGQIGIGLSPTSRLHIAGGRWNLGSTEGDFKIGNDTYRLKMGVALAGNGAGDSYIRAVGGTNRLLIGAGTSNVLTVRGNSRVGIGTTNPDSFLDVRSTDASVSGIRTSNVENGIDLILAGIADDGTGDDGDSPDDNGIISTDPRYPGSDLIIRTYDDMVIHLDENNGNVDVGKFEIKGGANNVVLRVEEKDNPVYAPLGFHGDVSGIGSIGVSGTSIDGIGVYGESRIEPGNICIDGGCGLIGVRGDGDEVGVQGVSDSIGVQGFGGVGIEGRGNLGVRAISENSLFVGASFCLGDVCGTQPQNRFRVDNSGRGYFNGGSQTGGADVAEFIDTQDNLQPGDVVEIDPIHPGEFRLSTTANNPAVAGVISTDPAISMNAENPAGDSVDTRPQLALVGRVPVKVSAENGPIRPGDLLVSAATPGYAMLAPSEPQFGTIIGKALDVLETDTGTIEMLVMLR